MARALRVVVWVTESGWEAAVDAVALLGDGAEVTLLHVAGATEEAPGGALAGLLGRRRPDLEARVTELAGEVAEELLAAAAERLGRPAERVTRRGRPEHEVVAAAGGADVLVVARATLDPGPRSLGHGARFVVDHAPCRVLLVWPGEPPRDASPPPPAPPPGRSRP
jgi:nucleotide-binding universal stress UspA family protein